MSGDMLDKIGRYTIRGVLGKGAMGTVYRGYDAVIEREVAIKTINAGLIDTEYKANFLERFVREAKAAARCNHPNIVTILEYGEAAGAPFIAMEFVEGMSLQEYLERRNNISMRRTLNFLSQILKALHFAHGRGVVHRDIKPANVLLLPDGHVKLTDFGVARLPASDLTQLGAAMGTPRYMAPEQAYGEEVDKRADLFSVGVMFGELLAKMDESSGLKRSIMRPIQGLPGKVKLDLTKPYPDIFIPILRKSLNPAKSQRFADAAEFARAVKQALSSGSLPKAALSAKTDPDATVLAPPAEVSVEQMTHIETALAEYVGPMAGHMVEQQLRHGDPLATLIDRLADEIPDAGERAEFLQTIGKDPTLHPASKPPTVAPGQNDTGADTVPLNDDELSKLRDDYAQIMGPLASMMIDDKRAQARSMRDLISALAAEIPAADERTAFLSEWSR